MKISLTSVGLIPFVVKDPDISQARNVIVFKTSNQIDSPIFMIKLDSLFLLQFIFIFIIQVLFFCLLSFVAYKMSSFIALSGTNAQLNTA